MAQKYTPDLFDFPHWQREYEALISETDEKRLPELAAALETALFERMQALANRNGTIEQEAIQVAIKTLRRVQEEKLNFPKWDNHYVDSKSIRAEDHKDQQHSHIRRVRAV